MGYNDKYPDMSAIYELQFREENRLKNKIKDLEEALTDTKKKLDIAIGFIKEIDGIRSCVKQDLYAHNKSLNSGIVFCWTTPDETHNVLEQINQKEEQ